MARSRHPNPHIERALAYADRLGWRIEKSGPRAHSWGQMYCPWSTRQGCKVGIYSTPRSPENHARHLIREIETCQHRDMARPIEEEGGT